MRFKTKEEDRVARECERLGRRYYREGKTLSQCPWADREKQSSFKWGFQAEARLQKKLRTRRALGF